MPNMIQAGTYSATLQYLKAVKAAGTKDTEAVAKKMKELPVDDSFAQGGKVLENGRMVHDLYLFEVKKPSEVQEALGLLQATRGRAGGQGVPGCQGQWLSADEIKSSLFASSDFPGEAKRAARPEIIL